MNKGAVLGWWASEVDTKGLECGALVADLLNGLTPQWGSEGVCQ